MTLEQSKFNSQTAQERYNFLLIRRRMLVKELSLLKSYVTNLSEMIYSENFSWYSSLINKITQEIQNCDENILFTEKTFFVNRIEVSNYIDATTNKPVQKKLVDLVENS